MFLYITKYQTFIRAHRLLGHNPEAAQLGSSGSGFSPGWHQAVVSHRLTESAGSTTKLMLMAVDRPQVRMDCWPEASVSL